MNAERRNLTLLELGAADPVGQQLLDELISEQVSTELEGRARRRAQSSESVTREPQGARALRLAVGASIGALLLLAAAAVLLDVGEERGTSQLDSFAAIAAEQNPPSAAYARQTEERRTLISKRPYAETVTARIDTWAGEKLIYRQSQTVDAGFPTPADRERWIELGRPPIESRRAVGQPPTRTLLERDTGLACTLQPQRARPVCAHKPTVVENAFAAAELPTDPDSLKEAIDTRAAADPGNLDEEIFFTAFEQLASPLAPPALRAALFELLGDVDGASVGEELRNIDGKEALAAYFETAPVEFSVRGEEMTAPARRYEIYVDRTTSVTLGVIESTIGQAGGARDDLTRLFRRQQGAERLPEDAEPLVQAIQTAADTAE